MLIMKNPERGQLVGSLAAGLRPSSQLPRVPAIPNIWAGSRRRDDEERPSHPRRKTLSVCTAAGDLCIGSFCYCASRQLTKRVR
jgi:hypothetical protein